jgi:photosystem I subunit 3
MLVVALWFNFAPTANADIYSHLTPCGESAAYQARAKTFVNTTSDPQSGAKRAAMYSEALCGPEGLPRLIVDGRFSHMGDFLIPGLMFLYSAGWIGWAGRSYLIAIRKEKNPALKEVSIDVPLAVSKMIGAFAWPLAAFGELTSGKLVVKDVPVSPR